MLPDLHKETRSAWLVLAGATLVVFVVVSMIWSQSGPLIEQLNLKQAEHVKIVSHSKQTMAARLREQVKANMGLADTIEHLKSEVGMHVNDDYKFKTGDHPEDFTRQLDVVRSEMKRVNKGRDVPFTELLGFPKDPPSDQDAQNWMTMLQLTEKILLVAFQTPSPLKDVSISHKTTPPATIAPPGRGPLLRKNEVTIDVEGGITDILWMLWKFSTITPKIEQGGAQDYPLVVSRLKINSDDVKQHGNIFQLKVSFTLAAMEFLTKEDRAASSKPGTYGTPSVGSEQTRAHP